MWECSRYNPWLAVWDHKGSIELPSDCFGDELYDWMVESEIIDDINNYDVDGDSSHIAVMGKTEKYGDFKLEFKDGGSKTNT